MNPIILTLLNPATPGVLSKLDPYLLAALKTGLVDYEHGDIKQAIVAIGFTLVCGKSENPAAVKTNLLDLFSRTVTARLTTSHLGSLSPEVPAYLTADVSLDLLLGLAQSNAVVEIQLCANLKPNRPAPRLVKVPGSTSEIKNVFRSTKNTILALIDHGCPFAHRAFLDDANQTCIFSIWDQDTQPDFPADEGSTPSGYGYGRQLHQNQLNGFIKAATDGHSIDESLCYELAQYPAMRSHYTHGTCTLGLMASKWQSPSLSGTGQSSLYPESMDVDIVFVQVPRAVPVAPDRGSVERCTLDGIRYVLDCAAAGSHVVVVVDYGTEMGSHDGLSWFERALDAMVDTALGERQIILEVIFPSGNSHDKDRRAVIYPLTQPAPAINPYPKNTSAQLVWWIPIGNDAPSAAEVWFDNQHANFKCSLLLPSGGVSAIELNGNDNVVKSYPDIDPYCVVVCKQWPGQRQILIQLSATNVASGRAVIAPAGAWQLLFCIQDDSAGSLDIYTHWGGQNPSMPQRVWPSKFVAGANQNGAVVVTGDGSILGSGCGKNTLMVSGYENWAPHSRSKYASGGKARDGKRKTNKGADCAAITEESPVLPGLLCLGTRSASVVRVRGTSFAAPQLARKNISQTAIAIALPTAAKGSVPAPSAIGKARTEYGELKI